MVRKIAMLLLLAGFLALMGLIAALYAQDTESEGDVEAFTAVQMVTEKMRGGEGVKFPEDEKFKKLMQSTTDLSSYNKNFSKAESLKELPPKVFERIPTKENVVFLTFDDGPYTEGDGAQIPNEKLLSILKSKNATGTFFFQGPWIWKNAEVVRQTIAQGSNVGNHTFHHPPDGYFMGPIACDKKEKLAGLDGAWQDREVLWERVALRYVMGDNNKGITNYFRSPHGSGVVDYPKKPASPDVIKRICSNGHIVINGNLNLSDARSQLSKAELVRTYRDYFGKGEQCAHRGEILWLHSGVRATADALPEIISFLQGKGYRVAALPQNLGSSASLEEPHPFSGFTELLLSGLFPAE
jgi:peptidoglycan/xylan/chitin deacetylase (PgdA/CDA1 family)